MSFICSSKSPTLAARRSLKARWAALFWALRFVGGASAAGFRPGLGRGGTTHSFLVSDGRACSEAEMGACRLCAVKGFAGANAWGEVGENAVGVLEADIMIFMVVV